jgi:hypothetical protein
VILITHIEGVRDGLDQVIEVRYDEQTGAAVVRRGSVTTPDQTEALLSAMSGAVEDRDAGAAHDAGERG